MNYMWVSNQE